MLKLGDDVDCFLLSVDENVASLELRSCELIQIRLICLSKLGLRCRIILQVVRDVAARNQL